MFNDVTVVIPARGGSKGLKNKNLAKIKGLSLVEIAITQAKTLTRNVILTSDSDDILKEGKKLNITCLKRSSELSTDTATTIDVIKNAFPYIGTNYIILFQPTHIFRDLKILKSEIKKFLDSGYECGLSAFEFNGFMWTESGKPLNRRWNKRPMRQTMKPLYLETGEFYIMSRKVIDKKDYIWKKPFIFEGFFGIDIHTSKDLKYASRLWSKSWLS